MRDKKSSNRPRIREVGVGTLAYFLPLLQVMVFSDYRWDWPAGPVLGPRYLAAMLPLLILPAALTFHQWRWTGATLAVISILITGTATLTTATPPGPNRNPLVETHIPHILAGDFNPNLGQLAGLPEPLSVVTWFAFVLTGALLLLRTDPEG